MKVTLISYTQDAAELLLFSKSTRLHLSPSLMDDIKSWSHEKKMAELEYAAKTIKSSWEMCDVVFLVEGVSRAIAQQITRTRNASYAMQSQRVTDVRNMGVHKPQVDSVSLAELYDSTVAAALDGYADLVARGMALEDARGVLPMNTQCNLICKYNLRAFTDLAKARASLRAQGEYGNIVRDMRSCVLEVWPWAAPFFADEQGLAIGMLEAIAKDLGITTGKGHGWEIAKAIDLIRKA